MNSDALSESAVVSAQAGMPSQTRRRTRLLVAIASYGLRNIELLNRVIRRYQNMAFDVDVVVVSDAEKRLGDKVNVIVGLPEKNPWSLPFAHKKIFAERVNDYDLFAYSEDDMEVTEENIGAFLRVTPELAPNEIAGFLRYEVDPAGAWSMPDAHGHFHWRPESIRQRGPHVVAEFTNDHSAYYLLTQEQLRRAIASGGFLKAPYEGQYDMLCTAATDVYTECGFRKVVCISSLTEFLIHHASNRYAGKVGVPLDFLKRQIGIQLEIVGGRYPVSTLCHSESRLLQGVWSKSYYEEPCEPLLSSVSASAKKILSIGCGWGATETELMSRGAEVTVMPLDSIMGALAAEAGMEVIYGSLDRCLDVLQGRVFDCVVMSNLLHLMEQPEVIIRRCSSLIDEGGSLLLCGPHLGSLHVRLQRALGKRDYRKLRAYGESGVHVVGPRSLRGCLARSGLEMAAVRWIRKAAGKDLKGLLLRLSASSWVVEARCRH